MQQWSTDAQASERLDDTLVWRTQRMWSCSHATAVAWLLTSSPLTVQQLIDISACGFAAVSLCWDRQTDGQTDRCTDPALYTMRAVPTSVIFWWQNLLSSLAMDYHDNKMDWPRLPRPDPASRHPVLVSATSLPHETLRYELSCQF